MSGTMMSSTPSSRTSRSSQHLVLEYLGDSQIVNLKLRASFGNQLPKTLRAKVHHTDS